jgi:transcriptional regulator GlxA family with amidase domain
MTTSFPVGLLFLLFGAAFATVVVARGSYAADPTPRAVVISVEEEAATLAALKPPNRERPVVAVLGLNEGSETTDYLVPFGVIKRSGVADVFALAIRPGPIALMPALTIVPDATTAQFDQRFPEGADYVIVPAMHIANDAEVLAWIKKQAAQGATVVGICAGAVVLANAGVLHDKRATTHWFRVDDLRKADPSIRYVANRRYVADSGVVTTTGVSASVPISLAIVAAIGGRERADALARDIGAAHWGAVHDGREFRLRAGVIVSYATNFLAFWRHETVGIPVSAGVDEIALALTSNAYASTQRARVEALAASREPVVMRAGLRLLPDGTMSDARVALMLQPLTANTPAQALDRALADIDARYGAATARVVRLELEYPEADVRAVPHLAGSFRR